MNIMNSGIITLTTDFGTKDPYVGMMKGVIMKLNPEARIIDLMHHLPPQDITAAGFLLSRSYGYFPDGTIHVAVVDPGVGGTRRAVAFKTDRAIFIGPDNGLFSFILQKERVTQTAVLMKPDYHLPQPSSTFHGRDIFAPVAAHLSLGVPMGMLGPACSDFIELDTAEPEVKTGKISGLIIWIDRFGNGVTNITAKHLATANLEKSLSIQVGRVELGRINSSYDETAKGEALAIMGSFDRLEISVNRGDAARTLGLGRGDPVSVRHS